MAKAKKAAPAPKAAGGKKSQVGKNSFQAGHAHLFPKDARDHRIGRDIQPKRDLSRFVKWPRYVRIQRQRAILKKRLKVPPAINQFTRALDKNQASNLFRLLSHYRPETAAEKAKRRKEAAAAQAKDEKKEVKGKGKKLVGTAKFKAPLAATKPLFVKYGLNHVTTLVEEKKAKLVVIAHDVEPIELVVWLPALCRKMDVPYAIVKSKARLGALVNQKIASAVAVTEVRKEDAPKLEALIQVVKPMFNDNVVDSKKWGGGIMGAKNQAVIRIREKRRAREAALKVKA
jgi:large subunit ribosomal protein L7Ae